jgi:subfamily B ATP-binding cassette protein MsbA
MHWVGGRVMVDVRNELFSNLQRQSLVFFGRSDVGELISRCTNDVNVIEQAVSGTVAQITRAPFEILAPVLFALYYSWKHGLFGAVAAILLVFPLCIIPIVVLGRHVKRHSRRALSGVSRLVSRMQETFSGIRLIKACHMEETESRRFAVMNAAYFKEVIRALRAELLMTPLMEAVGVLCACAFLVFCFARGIQFSQIATVGAAAILAYRPVRQLAKIQATLQRSNAAAERIFDLLDVDETLPEARNPVKITAFQDRVRFENVSFRYTPDAPPVLSGISFDMPRGSVIAFVGETGSGKTTVANLLARFYDVSDGVVLLDGHDVREIEIASLRALVGVVAQDTILFNDTVARNIGYGCADATPERIEEAARQANAHEFISARSEGYEFVVGEKGFRLSGGEKQRIAIARAILQNPPILILDEATSALDTVTEQMVQQAISRVMEHRTVFAIAHRLSTIRHADLICVMDRGHIVERGTHQELYDQGGRYRDLCDMQFS